MKDEKKDQGTMDKSSSEQVYDYIVARSAKQANPVGFVYDAIQSSSL